jgi:hypothetical protein
MGGVVVSPTSLIHRLGSSLALGERVPRRILNGWVGIYRYTNEEERLFCVLLPGDSIARYPGCSIRALSAVESELCEGAAESLQPFIRQSFRLSQYDASARLVDFLFDAFCRLRLANVISGLSYRLPLTQLQMGELLGMSTVHVNRVMNALPPSIRVTKRDVHIEDLERLTKTYRPEYGIDERHAPGAQPFGTAAFKLSLALSPT